MSKIYQFPDKSEKLQRSIKKALSDFSSDLEPSEKEYLYQYAANIVESMGSFGMFTADDIDLPEDKIIQINILSARFFQEYVEQIAWIPMELLKYIKKEL